MSDAPDPTDPKAIFYQYVPPEFLRELTRSVLVACQTSHLHCYSRFDPQFARRLYGQERKYEIDQQMVNVGRVFAQQGHDVTAGPADTDCKGDSYALVQWGPVKMTQAKVDEEGACPRHAKYRDGYARESVLPFLGIAEDDRWGEQPLFALLTYTPADSGGVPASMRITFPDRSGEKILDHIDLRTMFPEEFEGLDDDGGMDASPRRVGPRPLAPVEHVPSELPLPLRSPNKTGDE